MSEPKTTTPKTNAAPAAPAKPKVAPVLSGGALALALPVRNTTRGSSPYPFDKLDAPVRDAAGTITAAYSFGVKNKKARELAQVVSNANKRYRTETGEGEAKVTTQTRHFFAVDTDPSTDPEGATARVYRDQ